MTRYQRALKAFMGRAQFHDASKLEELLSSARAELLDSIRAYVKLFPYAVPIEAIHGYCDALEDPGEYEPSATAADGREEKSK